MGSIVLFILLAVLRSVIIFWLILTSATNIHNYSLYKVLRATILFFDSNPVGRITARFSKDMIAIDHMMAMYMTMIAQGGLRCLTVFITLCVINPYLLIAVVILIFPCIWILKKGRGPMQECQKLDGISRGPIHSTFAVVISGLVSMRVLDRLPYFKQDFNNSLERCSNATFMFHSMNRWVGLRLDFICATFTVLCTAVAFAIKD